MVQDIHSKKKQNNNSTAQQSSHPGVVDFAQYKQQDATSNLDNPNSTSSTFANVISQMNIDNQRTFQKKSEKVWLDASTQGEMVSLLLCDIDQFDAYQSNYGEQSTSFMLLVVALALKTVCEKYDCLLAHYQKHEFAVLLKGGDQGKVEEVAQALRDQVSASKTEHKYSDNSDIVTLSVGISSIYPNSMQLMMRKAEEALNTAKQDAINKANSAPSEAVDKAPELMSEQPSQQETLQTTPEKAFVEPEVVLKQSSQSIVEQTVAPIEPANNQDEVKQVATSNEQQADELVNEESLFEVEVEKKKRFSALKSLVSKAKPKNKEAEPEVITEQAAVSVPEVNEAEQEQGLKGALQKHIDSLKTTTAKVKDKVLNEDAPLENVQKSPLAMRIDSIKAASDKKAVKTDKKQDKEQKEEKKDLLSGSDSNVKEGHHKEQATAQQSEGKTKSQSAIEKHIEALKQSSLSSASYKASAATEQLSTAPENELVIENKVEQTNLIESEQEHSSEPVDQVVETGSIELVDSEMAEAIADQLDNSLSLEPSTEIDNSIDFEPLAEADNNIAPTAEVEPDNSLDFEPLAELESSDSQVAEVDLANTLDFEPLAEVDNSLDFEPLAELESSDQQLAEIDLENTLDFEPLAEVDNSLEQSDEITIDNSLDFEPLTELESSEQQLAEIDLESALDFEPLAEVDSTLEQSDDIAIENSLDFEPLAENDSSFEAFAEKEVIVEEVTVEENSNSKPEETEPELNNQPVQEPVQESQPQPVQQPAAESQQVNVNDQPVEPEPAKPQAKPMSAIEKHIAALQAAKAQQGGVAKTTPISSTEASNSLEGQGFAQSTAAEPTKLEQRLASMKISGKPVFDKKLDALWKVCLGEKEMLSMFTGELDFFNAYIDMYGEEDAEKVLINVAATVSRACSKSGAMIFYMGKGCFTILLKGGNATQALRMAEQTRRLVVESGIAHQQSKVSDVLTMSIGLHCVFPAEQNSIGLLKQETDEALTMAILSGRNQTCL